MLATVAVMGLMGTGHASQCKSSSSVPDYMKVDGCDPVWVKLGRDIYFDRNYSSTASKVAPASKVASPTRDSDGSIVMVTRLLVDNPNKHHGSSEIITVAFDCKGKRLRIEDQVNFKTNMATGAWPEGSDDVDRTWQPLIESYANEYAVFFNLACPLVKVSPVATGEAAQPSSQGEWWSYDIEAKACLDDTTPQQQIAIFKDHGVNDDTLSYVKNERGEVMYAKIRATDNGDELHFVTYYHAYHKDGRLVTGKQSCEAIEKKENLK